MTEPHRGTRALEPIGQQPSSHPGPNLSGRRGGLSKYSPELLKVLFALGFFFCTLLVVAYLAVIGVLSANVTATLLMGMLAVMAGLLGFKIDWKNVSVDPALPLAPRVDPVPQAFGLTLESLHTRHSYQIAGNFEGEWHYKVRNTSEVQVCDLLPEKVGWFSKDFPVSMAGTIHGWQSGFLNLDLGVVTTTSRSVPYINGETKDLTYVLWHPRVTPGVAPGEELEYSVKVQTEGTEADAFTSKGSFAGMGTYFYAEEISCELIAPDGYRFIDKDFVLRDRTGATIRQSDIPRPRFSDEGDRVEWTIKKPIPSVVYLVRVVLVARG